MKTVLLALFAVVSVAFAAQGTFQRFAIDDFTIGEMSLLITIPTNPTFPISQISIFTDSGNNGDNLLGGERDLKLQADSGPANRVLTSNVDGGNWAVSTPNGATGFAEMQWDGRDNSFNLANNGLGGIDFTDGGLGTAFTTVIQTDVETVYTFTVVSPNGNQCTVDQTIPGTQATANYFIPFSSFSGNCDFTNVGAIVVLIDQAENVDSVMTLFAVVGDPDPSPSRTPSRQVSASNTPTPSRLTSASNTPTGTRTPTQNPTASGTRTPTPTPTTMCMCHCPAFTCELIFDPDDDENNVYYFDDDDHNPFGDPDPTSGGAITTLDPVSGSSVLEFSLALVVVALVAMF